MIQFVLLFSRQGKLRLQKWFDAYQVRLVVQLGKACQQARLLMQHHGIARVSRTMARTPMSNLTWSALAKCIHLPNTT